MKELFQRLGSLPYLLLGTGLLVVGLLSLNHIVNSFWPIDVQRIDLVRATALDQADPVRLLNAANKEIIWVFLAGVLVVITGASLPLAYVINQRLGQSKSSQFLVVLRQAMWIGLWFAFSIWLQMNRTFGWGVAILVAAVFIVVEVLLQVRTRVSAFGE
jgi:hypothetical protein